MCVWTLTLSLAVAANVGTAVRALSGRVALIVADAAFTPEDLGVSAYCLGVAVTS